MTSFASIKPVAGAVLCGTGAMAGIALYPMLQAKAIWIALGMVILGLGVAAWPMGGKR